MIEPADEPPVVDGRALDDVLDASAPGPQQDHVDVRQPRLFGPTEH